MPAQFTKDLPFGTKCEDSFERAFSPWVSRVDGRMSDFVTLDGEHLELKADRYKNPKNFFFERWSCNVKQKPGGPWRAEQDKVKWFAYWFVEENTVFLFRTGELIERLESLDLERFRTTVPNKGYVTEGFAVPRKLVEDLAQRV